MNLTDLISIKALTKDDLVAIMDRAAEMKKKHPGPILAGKILASCFLEPSTRTRLSFESAMKRLGGEVIGFHDGAQSALEKGESLQDTIRMLDFYSDIIALRHPVEGSAQMAAEIASVPVINAGDGANEHPTQTLLDLFTIKECQGRLDGLNIAFVGDLLHGRTVHSLAQALSLFDNRLYFVSPPSLAMPDCICQSLRQKQTLFSFHRTIEEVIDKVDILYVTRVQKERFASQELYEQLKESYRVNTALLQSAKKNLKILHPLPRLTEIDQEVDATPFAYYFNQAENGVYVRQAILSMVLGK